MNGLKVVARIVALAAGAVGVGVTDNQVLNDGKLSFTWAYISWAVAVLAALYAEVFSPDPDARGTGRPAGGAVRGRRRIYLRQLRDSVRDMETIGVPTQSAFVLGLRQVYVDVSLAPQPLHGTATEPYVGQAHLPPGERRTLASFMDGDDVGRVFAVIGGPGSGKTTLMRSTALQLCHRRLRHRRLPILLYLLDHAAAILAADPPGLATVAAHAGWVAGTTPASWIERRLDRGGCLVMLDGLDEVADETERGKVVAWVRHQIERYPRNVYLLSSRPHGYLSNPLPNADALQVCRFTGEQISRFLHNWYYAIECRAHGTTDKQIRAQAVRKADDLLGRLRTQPGLYDLAANPLLLTMIANVHRYRDALPGSRAALYKEMCEVLVHRRQESKGLIDQTGLRGEQKAHIVQGLALTMMRAKTRDLSAADACRAIAEDLRGASPQMAPADFLNEVHKSGLLVEREHDRFAFAHLTLQEYLAAAHLDQHESHLLASNIDDTWWRETILLWAAGADATPIVTACLNSRTVRALALAFDCADEARAIAPEVRRQLERLLDPANVGADAEHRRLIATVKAARSLSEVIWLSDDTVICARPVTNGLYHLFALDDQAAGRHTSSPCDEPHPSTGEDDPAVGMWAGDAARFIAWLNTLFDDGTTYRLPSLEELTDSAFGLVTDLAHHTIWAHTTPRPSLYRPDGALWPYTPNADQLHQTLRADLALTRPYVRLALTRSDHRDRILAHSRVLSVALTLAPALGRRPDLRILELVLYLAFARAINHIRTRLVGPELVRTLAHGLTRDLALDLALTLDRDRDRALDPALALDRELTLALDRELTRDLDVALVRALDPTLALAPTRIRDLDRELTLTLDRIRDLDVDLDIDLDLARDLARARDGARTRDRDRDLTRDRALGLTLDRALDRALDIALDLDLTRARDLACDLDLTREFMASAAWQQTVTVAVRHLLGLWAPRRYKKAKSREVLADFDAFLAGILAHVPWAAEPAPADPSDSLQHARNLLGTPPQQAISDRTRALRNQARLLTEHVQDLTIPILDRTVPNDGHALAGARVGLLAAIALLREADDEDAVAQVLQTLRSLTAVHQRADGNLTPNEILLLIRT